MGYELNQLMKQYGVSTPGVVNYSGAAAPIVPIAPTGERPVDNSEDAAVKANQAVYDKQLADFNAYKADPSAFNQLTRKYDADQAAYNTYKTDYQNRVQSTPMYLQSQFQSTPPAVAKTVKDMYNMYLNREPEKGIDGTAAASTRPNFTNEALAEIKARGLASQNIYNATGSFFGNQLAAPTYNTPAAPAAAVPATAVVTRAAMPVTDTNNSLLNASNFDSKAYLAANPDVANEIRLGVQNYGDAYGHYNRYGKNEGRAATMLADVPAPVPAPVAAPVAAAYTNYTPAQINTFFSQNPTADLGGSIKKYNADPASVLAERVKANTAEAASRYTYAYGGSVHDLADKYAYGGQVKTHYQTAGAVKLPSGYSSVEEEQDFANRFRDQPEAVSTPVNMNVPPPPMMIDAPVVAAAPKSALTQVAANNLKADPMPAAGTVPKAPKALPFGGERLAGIQALLDSYGPKDSTYAADLTTARAAAKAETDAFARMLTGAMNSPEDAQSSKAEMYFRLAAAFGAPTKTGQFAENLGMVGKELGEYAKGKRATAQQKLALGLEAQKMKMASSKEDLNTLRTLSAEEMKDKRAIATELIKDYIKSGEPQSAAGKQALDEGFKTGTPDYQKRVAEIGNMKVEAQMAQITSTLANMGTAQANLALAQEKFANLKTQQAKLSPAEMKLKIETEDTLAQTNSALGTLKQAYALNPNTFDNSISDVAQRKALEVTDSKNPKVIATREQENLLQKAALAQLKSTFPGAISNDERKALQDVQGLAAKSREERAKIMKNAYTALQSVSARHAKRLKEINEGVYRDTASPIEGGPD
jgi:hypothetical protein